MNAESREPKAESTVSRRTFVGALAVAFAPRWLELEDVTIVEFRDDGRQIRTVTVPKIIKTDEQWRKQLSELAYRVTRQGSAEPAYGLYWEHRERGVYRCICCNTALFHSTNKFFPGTGWASFWKPIAERNVVVGEARPGTGGVTLSCRRCDAHIGNRYLDNSPTPTGERYNIESVAIRFFPG
jgi:peptide-methionine (R)-S-oxide reductase